MQRKSVGRGRDCARGRRGLSAPEVLVVVVIVVVVFLFVAMALPRQRETARLATCRNHLRHFGVGLVLYDEATGHLPPVAEAEPSPQKALLETLGLPDLTQLDDPKKPPRVRVPQRITEDRRVPGFICPSDTHAGSSGFAGPISYRATAGDAPDGRTGPFAPGRVVSLATIETGKGLSYVAGFSERLIGSGRAGAPSLEDYAATPGPLAGDACPPGPAAAWLGDAGSSWLAGNWRSTLYNHALIPNARPSCLADDQKTAFMGASSGHVAGVNVLFCDGSVRTFTPRVDLKLWRTSADLRLTSPP